MNTLLSWQSLVFYVPVAFGALLAVGAACGFVGDGHDVDDDVHEGDPSSLLAVGRLPMTVRLMLTTLAFGGIGLVSTLLLSDVAPGTDVGAVAAVIAAITGTLVVDRAATRWIARRMPLFETQTVRRAELVGAMGRVVLTASEHGGVAQVRDRRGDLHQVSCRLGKDDAVLPPGADVLLVEYDERKDVYLVERSPFPLSRRGGGP